MKMQIKPKVDLPVGKNLLDHIAAIILPFIINKPESLIPGRDFGLKTFTDYFGKGVGKFRSASEGIEL